MSIVDGLPINFSITKAARAAVEIARADWNAKFADKADVFTIGWGELVRHDGAKKELLCVSFYTKKERPEIEKGIEILDGLEIFFYVNRFNHGIFRGKVIDYDTENGFHFL